MINTVIFDIGLVLVDFDCVPYVRELFKDESVSKRVLKAIWGTGFWSELDYGRDKEEVEPWRKGEKSVNLSIARVEHVPFAREDPKEQARKDKEKTNDKIAGGGSEELRHFFPEDREHDS